MKKLLVITLFAACGGGSGVDSGAKLVSLTDAEVNDECSYLVGEYPTKDFSCDDGDGGTVTVHYGFKTTTDCATSFEDEFDDIPDCTATVGDAEDCIDYTYGLSNDAFCTTEDVPAACAALDSDACSPSDTSARGSAMLPRSVANARHLLAVRLR